MIRFFIIIYDRFRKAPAIAWSIFAAVTALLVYAVTTLSYKEDISDFLPLDEENQTALSIYQEISGANKIYAILSARDTTASDPDKLVAGVDSFVAGVEEADSLHYIRQIMKVVDMEKMLEVADMVYENIPYFLTDSDYRRMDSLLSQPGYVDARVAEDKELLLFPSSGVLAQNM